MYFLFVLVFVYYLCLHCLRKNAILSRKISIIHINTLKYSSTIVYELAFRKRQLCIVLVLVYVRTDNCIKNLVVTHHLDCLSSSSCRWCLNKSWTKNISKHTCCVCYDPLIDKRRNEPRFESLTGLPPCLRLNKCVCCLPTCYVQFCIGLDITHFGDGDG